MRAVIFEVQPAAGQMDSYLEHAAHLRPLLDQHKGFISVERFQSLADPQKLLSLSFFTDETAIAAWRNSCPHRVTQSAGRDSILTTTACALRMFRVTMACMIGPKRPKTAGCITSNVRDRPMANQPTLANWLSIAALGLIWGATFMVVAIALEGYGPLTVACARTTLGAVALLVLMAILRRPLPDFTPTMCKYLVVIGLLNTALPFALLSWGQQYVPSAFAGISMAVLPLFVLPLAHVFTDEKMSFRNTLGVILGFIGAIVLIGPGVLRLGTGLEPWGQLACIGASISYAVSSIMTRRCPPIDPIAMAALLLTVGAAALIPAMLLIEGVPAIGDARPTIAIIVLGFIPTALAALIRVATIRSAGAIFMTLVNYQVPLWSMVFGVLILNEVLPLRFFAALGLIMFGLVISQWAGLRKLLMR